MNYLEGLLKLLSGGEIQYTGTMDIKHEAEWAESFHGYYPKKSYGLEMMTKCMSRYGMPPFRFKINLDCKGMLKGVWGAANTNAIYWLCIEPLDIITDLKLIIKIGQTAAEGGMWWRFSNYSKGIFYQNGIVTNIAVYEAMVAMGVSRVHVYHQIQPAIDVTVPPWDIKEKTTGNMIIRERTHVAMYTDDMGKKPIGNKQ